MPTDKQLNIACVAKLPLTLEENACWDATEEGLNSLPVFENHHAGNIRKLLREHVSQYRLFPRVADICCFTRVTNKWGLLSHWLVWQCGTRIDDARRAGAPKPPLCV
jgi:hypothetical protein